MEKIDETLKDAMDALEKVRDTDEYGSALSYLNSIVLEKYEKEFGKPFDARRAYELVDSQEKLISLLAESISSGVPITFPELEDGELY